MTRRPALTLFTIALALVIGAGLASACGDATCDVERSYQKTENGLRCTITAKGETTAEQVRQCVRGHMTKAAHEGVTVSFEDVEGGIVVVQTGATPDAVTAIHAMATGCAKGEGCCKKGTSGCTKTEVKAQAGCDKHETQHAGCDKKTTETAAKDGCCAKKTTETAAKDGCCAKKTEAKTKA